MEGSFKVLRICHRYRSPIPPGKTGSCKQTCRTFLGPGMTRYRENPVGLGTVPDSTETKGRGVETTVVHPDLGVMSPWVSGERGGERVGDRRKNRNPLI